MRPFQLFLFALLATLAAAQDNWLSSIVSDVQSVYSGLTSVLAASTTSTSSSTQASTTSSSSTSSSSESVSSTSSTSATPSASPSVTPSATPTPTSVSADAASANNDGGSSGSNTLPIVLGCTLGALALAAFLALFFFCRRRRNRSRATAAKHRPLSPNDDEIESWRHEKPSVRSSKEPMLYTTPMGTSTAAAPLMSETSGAPYAHHQHDNPFVPVPPPARRSNMHDTSYSAHPYSPDHVYGYDQVTLGQDHRTDHNGRNALAAGVGGAALGGLAAPAKNRHDRKRSMSRERDTTQTINPDSATDEYSFAPQGVSGRRSGSVGRASAKEPWPFMDAHDRRSMDSGRSGKRSSSRSHDQYLTPDQYPADSHNMPSTTGFLGAAAVGGLAGAAASRKAGSHSPHRKGILKQTISDSSDPSSLSDSTREMPVSGRPNVAAHNSGPHELGSADIPPTPTARERRDSAIGTAAPLAAMAAHSNRRRSRSSSQSPPHNPPSHTMPTSNPHDLELPTMPSRSPKRTSLDYRGARYSHSNEGTAELSGGTPRQELVSPPLEAQFARDNDGVVSPISPMGGSQSASWSRAQAQQHRMNHSSTPAKPSSQESTIINPSSLGGGSSDESDQQSSGLVSAIQRIFSSQKSTWADEESMLAARPQTGESNQLYDDTERRMRHVPHRRPAPNRSSQEPNVKSYYGDLDTAGTDNDVASNGPGAWPQNQQQHLPAVYHRQSTESPYMFPSQHRSRGNSLTKLDSKPNTTNPTINKNNISTTDFAPTPPAPLNNPHQTSNSSRPRSSSRPNPSPGYGLGSGDPFDLARVRTDSSMTGISLSNLHHHQPAHPPQQQQQQHSSSSSPSRPTPTSRTLSSEYNTHEPTLADLRREVVDEDRERARAAWRDNARSSYDKSRSVSRTRRDSAPGLRYGEDRDLFELVDQTTGNGGYADPNGRFYAQGSNNNNHINSGNNNNNNNHNDDDDGGIRQSGGGAVLGARNRESVGQAL